MNQTLTECKPSPYFTNLMLECVKNATYGKFGVEE